MNPCREPVLVGYGTSNEKPVRRRRRPTTPRARRARRPDRRAPRRNRCGMAAMRVARSTEERLTTEQPRPRTEAAGAQTGQELGIDLAAVDPTGPGAVITRADVERAAAQRQSAPTGSGSRSSRYAA